jgi:hypothetical protein
MVVYDSGGQVSSSPGARSQQWKNMVISMRKAPFGTLDFVATPLVDHFYEVEFFESESDKPTL